MRGPPRRIDNGNVAARGRSARPGISRPSRCDYSLVILEARINSRRFRAKGIGDAQNWIGVFYEDGRGGLAKSETDAAAWYRKAAESGDDWGERNLAVYYEAGRGGLPKDDAQAVAWYQKSAAAGNAEAQNSLGIFYEWGRGGLKVDYAQAFSWLRKAADQGDARTWPQG